MRLGKETTSRDRGTPEHVQTPDGVLEVRGGLMRWMLRHCTLVKGGASALTLGHVVLGRDAAALDKTRRHERVHVRQCECWGPLFIPAYLLASFWVYLCRRDPYLDNPFECAARRRSE